MFTVILPCRNVPSITHIYIFLNANLLKLAINIVKLKKRIMGFLEIEDDNQNVGWDYVKKNNRRKKLKFFT